MTASIADLVVTLGADTVAFEKDLGRAAHLAQKNMESIESVAQKAGAVLSASVIAGATAFALAAKSAVDYANDLDDMASRAGVGAENLSRLAYAAQLNATNMDSVSAGLRKLNDNIALASAGSKAQKAAFDALGVSVADASGKVRSADQVMLDIAEGFSKFENGAVKAALANDLFGKAGSDLIPMLNQGRAGLKALGDEAARVGAVISDETAAQAAEFNDRLDKMQLAAKGVVNQLTSRLLPAVNDLAIEFDSLSVSDETIDQIVESVDALVTAAEGVAVIMGGRLASSIAQSGYSMAVAQAEAIRYQASLARMAGSAEVASVAMTGVGAAAKGVLGFLGGPVGLVATLGLAAISFVDFSEDANTAVESAKDFDEKLASMTGNAERLSEITRRKTLDSLQADIQSRMSAIEEINRQSELSNQKLGLGEIQRIQELQTQLARLGQAYQDVSSRAEKPLPNAPTYPKPGGRDLDKPVDEAAEFEKWLEDESKKQAAINETYQRERDGIASVLADLQQAAMTKRAIAEQELLAKEEMILRANELVIGSEQLRADALLGIRMEYVAQIAAIDAEEVDRKKKDAKIMYDFAQSSLTAIGNRSKTAAKAAELMAKITALRQIAADTGAAAMAAARWAAVIGGPAAGFAAATAMYGLGAAAAASVISGSGRASGSASASYSGATAASTVTPVAESAAFDVEHDQITYVGLPANRFMTGRDLVDAIDEALGDGYSGRNMRFVLT